MVDLGTVEMDALVLAIIVKSDEYAYTISQKIKEVADFIVPDLYLSLKRLKTAGLINTYFREFSGRQRTYYHATLMGATQHEVNKQLWQEYKTSMDGTLKGADECEKIF